MISLFVLGFILLQVYVVQNREKWAKKKSTKAFKMETNIENMEGELHKTRQLIPKLYLSY